MRRRRTRSAVSPWNVDRLRSTTLRGIRSARSGSGQRSFRSSALKRKSCQVSVSVMLEKRGGRCRTDGRIRVLSNQIRNTIAAIKAAWCRSRSWASSRRASDFASCERFTTACSKRWVHGHGRRAQQQTDHLPSAHHLLCYVCASCSGYSTLSILRGFVACAAAVQTAVLVMFGPSCVGHYR